MVQYKIFLKSYNCCKITPLLVTLNLRHFKEIDGMNNIINISDFTSQKDEQMKNQELTEYLSVLTFNELITEANVIIRELKSKPVDQELIRRSNVIMKQFSKRLKMESPHLAKSILSGKKQINVLYKTPNTI